MVYYGVRVGMNIKRFLCRLDKRRVVLLFMFAQTVYLFRKKKPIRQKWGIEMIEIRDSRIYFYHAHKPEVQVRDFECLSAYVCPVCKNVLLAYFVGYIDNLTDYTDIESMKHAYEMGNCNGGQWIALQEYKHKATCKWQYVTARGVSNGVDAFLNRWCNFSHQRKPLELMDKQTIDKQALIDAIEKGLDGFIIVPDVIGADAPLLMYNENEIREISQRERLPPLSC